MNIKIMNIALDKAASGYAEKIARENGLIRISCPSVDYAVRHMVFELVNAGLINFDEMYDFLDKRQYRDKTPDIWWNDD